MSTRNALMSLLALISAGSVAVVAAAGSNIYAYRDGAANVTLQLGVSKANPLVKRVEACRSAVHAKPLSYALSTIDNRAGETEEYVGSYSIVTKAGKTIALREVWQAIDGWKIPAGSTSLYNRCEVSLYNAFLNRGAALPGAVRVQLFVVAQNVSSVRYVFVNGDASKQMRQRG